MIKLLQKLESWANDKFDRWDNKKELKKWNRLIKKACKKNFIRNEMILNMYYSIQKEVLEKVNDRGQEGIYNKEQIKNTPFSTIIKQRIYDLNREFIYLINGEYHNSLFALTRQMTELYILLLYCRYKKPKIDNLLKEKRQTEAITNIVNSMKKKINTPYVKEVSSEKFVESALNWFYFFSNMYHISGSSLSQNMWIWNEEKNSTRLYVDDPNLKEGEKLLIFSKKSSVHHKEYQIIIHQFYTFTGVALTELKLLGEEK